jgi:hypothetical protein
VRRRREVAADRRAAFRAEIHEDHPALVPLTAERAELYFRGSPEDPDDVGRRLHAAHERVVGPYLRFEKCVNANLPLAELLRGGHGQIASGPLPVLDAYARVLETHNVSVRMVGRAPARTWDEVAMRYRDLPTRLRVLDLGESFVVAQRFTLTTDLPPLPEWRT